MTGDVRPIRVGLDVSLASWSEEIKYVFRTLMRIAGYPYEFVWVHESDRKQAVEIFYGSGSKDTVASVRINAGTKPLTVAPVFEPLQLNEHDGVDFLNFEEKQDGTYHYDSGNLIFSNDIIFSSYWLLTGAREPKYHRDRWDNFHLENSFFLKNSLASKPLVSLYGALLRKHFKSLGREPLNFPWTSSQAEAAFVFSHDVDYPQMIPWMESIRLFSQRGFKGINSIVGVVRGTNNFWKFSDWVEFEKRLGTRPAFYFMAKKGSLFKYALGKPDTFYDIHSEEFQQLFRYLKDEGCEIGLHASYESYRSAEQLRREKELLEEVAGVEVSGNRHHFWHLDPLAPSDSLRIHEQAGLLYDSSLAFEFYPGFRRGICHPFRVFHPGERRELNVVELPPAWMDDHFHRRLKQNRIKDAEDCARRLLETARSTGGIVVVDYHVRGMNKDFFPLYGSWLMKFIQNHADSSVSYCPPEKLARMYLDYEASLTNQSRDLTVQYVKTIADPKSSPAEKVTVGFLQTDEQEKWDNFVEAHPSGNIYHTIAWQKVTEEGFGHRAYYLRTLDKSGQVTGILPLFLVKGLFGRRLVSVPMRDRGGVLGRDRETASLLISQAIDLTRELNCKYLELRSLEEMNPDVVREHNLCCERHWITTRVDLSPGVDKLWKALEKKSLRWAIKKSGKLGITIEIDDTLEGIETFYEMFVRTRRSLGIPPFSKRLFVSIWEHLIDKDKANLFLAWKGSEPVNGMINFLSKDTFIPAYAAPQNEWRKHYPSEFVIWNTIEWAALRAFHRYDFGADSPHQKGLLWFKKKWGGVQHPMFYYYFLNGVNTPPSFDSSANTYSFLRKIWTRLPIPVCKYLGSWVTRQLS